MKSSERLNRISFKAPGDGYRSIKKLFLPGLKKIITPYPLDHLQSWLEDSPVLHEAIYFNAESTKELLKKIVLPDICVDRLKIPDHVRVGYVEQEIYDEFSISPFALYGKVENGALNLLAYFYEENSEGGCDERVEFATVINCKVEWENPPEKKATQPTDANQSAELR